MIGYFGRDLPSSGRTLRMGQKRKRNADASSALYRASESVTGKRRMLRTRRGFALTAGQGATGIDLDVSFV
jgi:hypothetical protein